MDNTQVRRAVTVLVDILNSGKRDRGARGRGIGKEGDGDGIEGWFQAESRKENGMAYTALKTSNKINVVSGDSIRKTHRTISHTILRQNGQDSYLLHGRSLLPPITVYPLTLARSGARSFSPAARATRFLYLRSLEKRDHAITLAKIIFEQIGSRLIARERKLATEGTTVGVSVARAPFRCLRYANQTLLYRGRLNGGSWSELFAEYVCGVYRRGRLGENRTGSYWPLQ